jgi:hypothetical protein
MTKICGVNIQNSKSKDSPNSKQVFFFGNSLRSLTFSFSPSIEIKWEKIVNKQEAKTQESNFYKKSSLNGDNLIKSNPLISQ